MNNLLYRIRAWWQYCRKYGHHYHFEGDSMIGEWIKCCMCGGIDEYVPGAHEPKGYSSKYDKKNHTKKV